MENKKILIVEDNSKEAEFALELAKKFNLEAILSSDFSAALKGLESEPSYVLSDLFFPAGEINQAPYIQKLLPIYENYLSTFPKTEKEGVLYQTLENLSKVFKTTPEKYVEEILPLFNNPQEMMNLCEDAVHGVKNYSSYLKLQNYIEELKQGKNLAYGYFLAEEAQKRDVPVRIVTSTDHHDITFEPIRNSLRVPYYDNLVEGKKNWQEALQDALSSEGRK